MLDRRTEAYEKELKTAQWRNLEWEIKPDSDGQYSVDAVTHALLIDIRTLLRKVKNVMVFFTALTVIGLVLALISALARM